jgi:HEAT repeat protein
MKPLLVFVLACAAATAADLDSLVRRVAGYDFGTAPAAVRELEAESYHAAGTAQAAAVEKALIAGLAAAHSLAAKDAFCRDLTMVGGDASVDALAPMLLDPKTAEMARYAIEKIPGARPSAALREALARTSPPVQTGMVVSLGRRKDARAVPAIQPLLVSKDAAMAEAAAAALGSIGTVEARDALALAPATPAVSAALLRIAEASSPAEAAKLYLRLADAQVTEAVRIAALIGLARTSPKESVRLLHNALTSSSPRVQAAAIRALAPMEGIGLAQNLAAMPDRTQVLVLAALVDCRAPGVLAVISKAADSGSPAVRVVALSGIGQVGTAAEIPMLAARAAASTGDEQAAARFALASIRGLGADAAISRAIPGSDAKVKVELIRAFGERGTPAAAEVILPAASDSDRAVRLESIRALRETAAAGQVPELLELLTNCSASDRREWERTVAAAIRRSPGNPVGDVVTAYQSANAATRASLLNVLSAVGNSAALPLLRQQLAGSDAELQRLAVNALAGWPTPEPMDDLLTLARSAPDPTRRILALRGYIQLAQLPSSRTPPETAGLLKTAMLLATRPEEKKAIMAAVQRVICPESLVIAQQALSDPQVAAEAKLAATTLEHDLAFVGQ